MPEPLSFAERFRTWYAYERDCNAKVIQMLQSVPQDCREDANFARAVGRMAHLLAARHMWFFRLGQCTDRPGDRFDQTTLTEPFPAARERSSDWFPRIELGTLPTIAEDIESRWATYLATLNDDQLAAEFTYTGYDGKLRRYRLIDLLTQVFGHAWYHRGQIAMLVKDLGGKAVDTDYIFFNRPTLVET
jgi:uncharacterized damage-inducible protein DinB